MRPRRLARAWPCLFVVASSLACSSSPRTPSSPPPAPAEAPFDAVQRTLAARGAGAEYRSFTVEERESDYVRGFRERATAPVELRELVFHGVFRPDHPNAAGALQVDEVFLARAFDPKPYAEYDVAAMVELARLVKLRLRGVVDVKWFVHGEHDALVEVRATADATRFEFHRNRSGEAGEMPWHGLALDRDGVPARLE
jgi:hypothetical protein